MRTGILFLAALAPAFAGDWTGFLVDSGCYAALERNVNPGDANPHLDSDMNYEIRYCSPGPKTRNFALVRSDWNSISFDDAGNAKAGRLMQGGGKRHFFWVAVHGEPDRNRIRVDTITPARPPATSSVPRISRE